MLLETIIAAHFLVIDPNGTRSNWNVKPESKQVHPGAVILELPPDFDTRKLYEYQEDSQNPGKAIFVTPEIPEESVEQSEETKAKIEETKARLELMQAVQEKATDANVSDEDFIKLWRLQQASDDIKAKWDSLKEANPELAPTKDAPRKK